MPEGNNNEHRRQSFGREERLYASPLGSIVPVNLRER
jgi:hypothetical protein